MFSLIYYFGGRDNKMKDLIHTVRWYIKLGLDKFTVLEHMQVSSVEAICLRIVYEIPFLMQ